MPRWRTMIEPAGTSWPSPTFTPRRWPTESRPFFELDPAFLWAMGSTRPSSWRAWPSASPSRPAWRRPRRSGSSPAASSASALAVEALVVLLAAGLAAAFGAVLRRSSRRPWRSTPWPEPRPSPASRRARRPRRPAWRRPPRDAVRSVFASASAFCLSAAALRLPSLTSVIRRTISSWRWPFLTRLRAFGRYLNEISFSPRSRRTTSASTAASATIGVPMAEVVAVGDEEDPIEGDVVAGLRLEQLDLELGADLDAVLLPAGLDDCVHGTLRTVAWRSWSDRDNGHGETPGTSPSADDGVYGESRPSVNRARMVSPDDLCGHAGHGPPRDPGPARSASD